MYLLALLVSCGAQEGLDAPQVHVIRAVAE